MPLSRRKVLGFLFSHLMKIVWADSVRLLASSYFVRYFAIQWFGLFHHGITSCAIHILDICALSDHRLRYFNSSIAFVTLKESEYSLEVHPDSLMLSVTFIPGLMSDGTDNPTSVSVLVFHPFFCKKCFYLKYLKIFSVRSLGRTHSFVHGFRCFYYCWYNSHDYDSKQGPVFTAVFTTSIATVLCPSVGREL